MNIKTMLKGGAMIAAAIAMVMFLRTDAGALVAYWFGNAALVILAIVGTAFAVKVE